MSIILNYFILSLQLCSFSMNVLNQIIDGNLSRLNDLEISIKAYNLRGMVFYSFDSEKNQFGMEIIQGKNQDKHFRLTFNKGCNTTPLKSLCGCDPCNEMMVTFFIQFYDNFMGVMCNNRLSNSQIIWRINNTELEQNCISTAYPQPIIFLNTVNKMYISIGNVGPYVSNGNIKIVPVKEEIIGCLDSFIFNSNKITFTGSGTKVKPSCKCDSCNGGKCTFNLLYEQTCDCSSTSLSGLNCNRSLIKYVLGNFTSLKTTAAINNTYLKMSWKQSSDRTYCLMEIIGRDKHDTIWIKDGHLMLDSKVICIVNVSDTNFVSVNISRNRMVIKTNIAETSVLFSLSEYTLINVGYTKKINMCKSFTGLFDLQFDKTEMNYLYELPATSKETQIPRIIVLVIVSVGLNIMLVVLMLALYIRGRKRIQISNIYEEPVDTDVPHYDAEDSNYEIIPMEQTYDDGGYVMPTEHPTINSAATEIGK